MNSNRKANMLTFLLHVISMVFVMGIVVLVIMLLLPSQPGTYAVFDDMIASADTACNPNYPAHVSTPLTVEPGYFIIQIYNSPDQEPNCFAEERIVEEKFWEYCPHDCDEGNFCLCVGKTTTPNHGIEFEEGLSGEPPGTPENPFEPAIYAGSVRDDRNLKCLGLSTGEIELEDNSLCCANIRCSNSQGFPTYLSNIEGIVFDGMYADQPGWFSSGFKIEGQFRFTRISPEDRNMYITYR